MTNRLASVSGKDSPRSHRDGGVHPDAGRVRHRADPGRRGAAAAARSQPRVDSRSPATSTCSPGPPTSSAASSRKRIRSSRCGRPAISGSRVYSGKGALKTASINFGVWNSLQTGSSGLDNDVNKLHYEEDFYAALGLGFSKATFTTTYTAYTSPNGLFGTVHEIAFKVGVSRTRSRRTSLLAQELGEVGADGGANKGTYVELGIGPSWPLAGGKATIAIPVKLGLSAHNYYELNGEDNAFGFFDVGALLTVPLSGVPASYGAWNFHVGGDVLAFGDTTKAFNNGQELQGRLPVRVRRHVLAEVRRA